MATGSQELGITLVGSLALPHMGTLRVKPVLFPKYFRFTKANDGDFVPLFGTLRLAPLSASLFEINSSGFPFPDSPLITSLNIAIATPLGCLLTT